MASLRISEPGIFTTMKPSDYFADPCPTPSVTQSVIKTLVNKSAWHAWVDHPRLNPNHESNEDTKFNIGNAAHTHLLGRGKDLVVVQADDWRTKAAQAAKAEANAAGKTAVLAEQDERAREMAAAALDQLAELKDDDGVPLIADWSGNGDGEVVIAWREGDLWFRSMIDWLPRHRRVLWDYKTTIASAAPHALPNKMADDGWCIQAAMHERGMAILDPDNVGRRKHRFVCQEAQFPYALTVTQITEGPMTMGRKQLEFGLDIWRRSMSVGTHVEAWPGYGREIQYPEFPGFKETKWLEREVVDDARRRENLIMAG